MEILFFSNVLPLPILLWVNAAESVFYTVPIRFFNTWMSHILSHLFSKLNIPNSLMPLICCHMEVFQDLSNHVLDCSNRSMSVWWWTAHHWTQPFRHDSPGLSREGASPHLNWWQFCQSSPKNCWHSLAQNTFLAAALPAVFLIPLCQLLFQLLKPSLFRFLEISLKRSFKGPFKPAYGFGFYPPTGWNWPFPSLNFTR